MPLADGFLIISQFMQTLSHRHTAGALYRGHANWEWHPMPSAYRRHGAGILTIEQLRQWKTVAARYMAHDARDLDWLVLAQHYGIETALLDWTTNPLVALFFACLPHHEPGQMVGTTGAVLIIERQTLWLDDKSVPYELFGERGGAPILVEAGPMNKRSLAQDSVMTLHCPSNSQLVEGSEPRFFYIAQESKAHVLAALKTMGISSDRMFADINTVAREFKDELFQNSIQRMFPAPSSWQSPPPTGGTMGGVLGVPFSPPPSVLTSTLPSAPPIVRPPPPMPRTTPFAQ